jgi:hypothetical protein
MLSWDVVQPTAVADSVAGRRFVAEEASMVEADSMAAAEGNCL